MWATSIGSTSLHRPVPGVRKSGMPEGTEMPAPDSATTVPASRTSAATRSRADSAPRDMPARLLHVRGKFVLHGDLAGEPLQGALETAPDAPAAVHEVGDGGPGGLRLVPKLERQERAGTRRREAHVLRALQAPVLELHVTAAGGVAVGDAL